MQIQSKRGDAISSRIGDFVEALESRILFAVTLHAQFAANTASESTAILAQQFVQGPARALPGQSITAVAHGPSNPQAGVTMFDGGAGTEFIQGPARALPGESITAVAHGPSNPQAGVSLFAGSPTHFVQGPARALPGESITAVAHGPNNPQDSLLSSLTISDSLLDRSKTDLLGG